MTGRPLLTLIVPAYNAANYLPNCLDDLLAQTFRDFEVLVMDDGSTDRTADIGEQYARRDPRIRVMRLPHGGVSAARNRGLEMAESRYVAFMDCDDRVDPQYLAAFFRTPLPDGDCWSAKASPSNTSPKTARSFTTTPTPPARKASWGK